MGLSWDLFSNEPGNLVYIVLEKPTCEKHLVPLFLSILVILPLKCGGGERKQLLSIKEHRRPESTRASQAAKRYWFSEGKKCCGLDLKWGGGNTTKQNQNNSGFIYGTDCRLGVVS